jgi:hypothetical protein
MKKISIALLALAAALAIAPAAMADQIGFSFTNPNNSQVFAFGILDGTNVGGNQWDITGGSISVFASNPSVVTGSGVLLGGTGSTQTSPNGAWIYDNEVFVPVSNADPYVDYPGLLFLVNGAEVNIFSDAVFKGAGTNTYAFGESIPGNANFELPGELNITAPDTAPHVVRLTPEPGSLLLLGTGLFALAFVAFRKAKPSGLLLHS